MFLDSNIRYRLVAVGCVVGTLMACSPNGMKVEQAKAEEQIFPQSTVMTRKNPIAITIFKGHSDRVASVVFSPDGKLIASASYDNIVKLWNPKTGQLIRNFPVQTTDENHNQEYNLWIESSSKLSFSQDGELLTLGNGYNALITWQVDTGKVIKKTRGRSSYTSGTTFSPDGNFFANTLMNEAPPASGLTKPGPDEIARLLSPLETGEIGIWDVKTGQRISILSKTGLSSSIAFSSDNQFLANNAVSGKVSLWNLKSGELLHTWSEFGSVAISPNNEFVAVNSNGCVKVWHLKTGKEIYSLEGERDEGQALAFSPDSNFLAASTAELNTITLWNLITGQKITTLSSPQVWSIAISSNSELIATGNFDNTVRVWRIR